MDKIKVIIGWIKAQHFWVLTLLAVCIAAAAWQLGSSQLRGEITANKAEISKQFTNTSGIANRPFHPNDDVNRVQAQENLRLANKVRETWQALYDRQVSEVLEWPPQLGSEFAREVSRLKFGDNIVQRDTYFNYIKTRFSDLPRIIDAPETKDDPAGGGGRGGRGLGGIAALGAPTAARANTGVEEDFLVQWHDQGDVRAQLTWDKQPSALDIWVTQEDLWVYETLLEAIARTNKAARADRYSNAAVRDIFEMKVGQAAANPAGSTEARIYIPPDPTGATASVVTSTPYVDPSLSAVDPSIDPLLVGRYVDATGLPMATATDGAFRYGTEYKRLPVRLVLALDQRWLNHLLIELANAPLQVEVREVRIQPSTAGRDGAFRPAAAGDGEVQAFDREPNLRNPVIIEGLVYIFYPPDETILAVESDGGDLAAAGP